MYVPYAHRNLNTFHEASIQVRKLKTGWKHVQKKYKPRKTYETSNYK